ncbi:MAG: hypothetical protein HY347_00255 [candidate division NC10 bacterium]|nr:hypothetical protein [candidate division NC10 bacterium]
MVKLAKLFKCSDRGIAKAFRRIWMAGPHGSASAKAERKRLAVKNGRKKWWAGRESHPRHEDFPGPLEFPQGLDYLFTQVGCRALEAGLLLGLTR